MTLNLLLKWLLWLLVFWLTSVCAGRDPFNPPDLLLCDLTALSLPPPQLRGIIGQKQDFRAWLTAANGRGRLWTAREWPNKSWQLLQVNAQGIILGPEEKCRPPLRMSLKGSLYENTPPITNAVPFAADAFRKVVRQPNAAFSGIR